MSEKEVVCPCDLCGQEEATIEIRSWTLGGCEERWATAVCEFCEEDALRHQAESVGTAKRYGKIIREAVNASCSCGGKGPEDPGVCPACMVWHRLHKEGLVQP